MGEVVSMTYSVSPKLDPIIDRVEAGELSFLVVDGKRPYLVFEINKGCGTQAAWAAAAELGAIFVSDKRQRQFLIEYAYNVGAVLKEV